MENLMIEISGLFPVFKEHLEQEGNSRILFSGKFGIGKTYFLNDFFEQEAENYEVFHLFPVDYQIKTNEDIIEFLKYDVLVELISKNKNIFKKEDCENFIDLSQIFLSWGKENIGEIFDTSLSYIPKLGRPIKDILKLIKSFNAYKETVLGDKNATIDKFVSKMKSKNSMQTDLVSEFLSEKIVEQKKNKQSILILDDLERIDPDHIFRILNTFSAHLNLDSEEMPIKFGFDKIIIVADIHNLKSIFYHKYGEKTDSSGYFNKFFSTEIFQFKNESVIEEAIDDVIDSMKMEEKDEMRDAVGEYGYIRLVLRKILKKSIALSGEQQLDLRKLLSGTKFTLPAFKKGKYHSRSYEYQIELRLVRISIAALISIFGGVDNDFLSLIKQLKTKLEDSEQDERFYSLFSFLLLAEIKGVEKILEQTSLNEISWSGKKIKINLQNRSVESITSNLDQPEEITTKKFGDLFYDLLFEYISTGVLKK